MYCIYMCFMHQVNCCTATKQKKQKKKLQILFKIKYTVDLRKATGSKDPGS